MLYYISGGKVYRREERGYRAVQITAEGAPRRVTVTPIEGPLRKQLTDPFPATLEEVIRKFHIIGDHPLTGE